MLSGNSRIQKPIASNQSMLRKYVPNLSCTVIFHDVFVFVKEGNKFSSICIATLTPLEI